MDSVIEGFTSAALPLETYGLVAILLIMVFGWTMYQGLK